MKPAIPVLLLFFVVCGVASAEKSASPSQTFNVMNYGAVADGKTMTDAIQKAIDAAGDAGGGRVIVPAGTYLTGPIHLVSNLDLHVEAGAVVLFSRKMDDYPLVYADYEGPHFVESTCPLTAENLHDISITGQGAFDGQGEAWRQVKKEKVPADFWAKLVASGGVVNPRNSTWYPSRAAMIGAEPFRKMREANTPATIEDCGKYRELIRPSLVLLSNCRGVLLDGPTFRNSPNWDIHPFLCTNITVRNVTLFNPVYAQNGDGIDFDSCSNVNMSDCTINAGDDAICLKSGRDEAGRKLNRPTENVTITRCKIGTGHGGITIGSEMSGDIRNVNVSDCDLDGTDGGLRFKSVRGRGGVVENINISNIHMRNINEEAIQFNLYYAVKKPTTRPEPVGEGTPQFRDFHISNITCDSAKTAMILRGLPEMPIEGITLENVELTAKEPGQIADSRDITLKNVKVQTSSNENVGVENVEHLTLENVQGVGYP